MKNSFSDNTFPWQIVGAAFFFVSAMVAFEYNNRGYLTHEKNAANGYVYREVLARDSRNQIKAGLLTDGLLDYSAGYFDATGQAKDILVTDSGAEIHKLEYLYDSYGNLEDQTTG